METLPKLICTEWKIDSKDPKICRNCKRAKAEHAKPDTIIQKEDSPLKQKEESPLKTIEDSSLKSKEDSPFKQKIKKEDKSINPKEEKSIKPKEDSPFKQKIEKDDNFIKQKEDSPLKPKIEKNDLNIKPKIEKELSILKQKIDKDDPPPSKPKEFSVLKTKFEKDKDDIISKSKSVTLPKEKEKTPLNPENKLISGKTSEEIKNTTNSKFKQNEEQKKNKKNSFSNKSSESDEKNDTVPVTKNDAFKNKLEGLFKGGGNPMRLNDDYNKPKKQVFNLPNGKRQSKTYEDIFDIVTKVEIDKNEIKKRLSKFMQFNPPGHKISKEMTENEKREKEENDKKKAEINLKEMNEAIMDRPQARRKTKPKQKKNLNFD